MTWRLPCTTTRPLRDGVIAVVGVRIGDGDVHTRHESVGLHFNADFEHMLHGLRAERTRLRGQVTPALTLYRRAIDRAIAHGNLHHAALLLERRSSLLRTHHRLNEAGADLRQAMVLYEQWGALAKVNQLQRAR